MITKEQIQTRIVQLQKQAEKLQNDLNATLCALQDCGYWMEQLKKEDEQNNL
jgi:hypothetical protein